MWRHHRTGCLTFRFDSAATPQADVAKVFSEPLYELADGVVALKTESPSGQLCKIEFYASATFEASGGDFAAPKIQLPDNWRLYMAEHPSGCNTWVAEKASDSAPAESPTSPLLNIGTAAHLSAVRVVQGITMTLHLAEDNVELCTELAVAASSPYFAKPAAEANTQQQPRALTFADAPPAREPTSHAIVPVRVASAHPTQQAALAPHDTGPSLTRSVSFLNAYVQYGSTFPYGHGGYDPVVEDEDADVLAEVEAGAWDKSKRKRTEGQERALRKAKLTRYLEDPRYQTFDACSRLLDKVFDKLYGRR